MRREGLERHGESGDRTLAGAVAAQKKSRVASERDEEERAAFRRRTQERDARLYVFVDECGTHTSMTRLYARAPKG